jgi:transposase
MRFVSVKTMQQQSIMMLHRVRQILIRWGAQLSNAPRSRLAEFGVVSPIGREGLDRLLTIRMMDGRLLRLVRPWRCWRRCWE